MTDTNQKRRELLERRKKQLTDFIGVPFEKIVERFTADLLGCLSGGSNEPDKAKEWLLFCFHQYFSCGDFDKDSQQLEKMEALLYSFNEPTNHELEGAQ